MGKFFFCLSILHLYFCYTLQAQEKRQADSLIQCLNQARDKNQQIDILIQISVFYEEKQADSALNFAKKAFALANKNQNPIQISKTQLRLGYLFLNEGEFFKALDNLYPSLKIAEKEGLTEVEFLCLKKIGMVEIELGHYNPALEFFQKALQIAESESNEGWRAAIFHQQGRVYMLKQAYEKALDYHQKSLKIRKQLQDEKGYSETLLNIGQIYHQQKKYKPALDYLLEASEVCLENNFISAEAFCKISIAEVYLETNEIEKSKEYANKALVVFLKIRNKISIKKTYSVLYKIFLKEGNYKKASDYELLYIAYEDSLFNEQKIKSIQELELNEEIKEKKEENESLKKDQDENKNTIQLQNILLITLALAFLMAVLLIILFVRQNQSRKLYTESLLSLNQQLSDKNEEVVTQAEELRHATEEVSVVNSTLEDMVTERTKQLKNANEELDMFIYHSSHDFRRPLTSLIGLYQLAKHLTSEKDFRELLENVRITAETMDKMLLKLMMVSDISNKNLETVMLKPRHFRSTISHIQQIYNTEIKTNKITFNVDINPKISFYSNDTLIHTILFVLMENAVSFCNKENPTVNIDIYQEEENGDLNIHIKDNGQGIDEEYKSKIYEMYFRANENSKGNGLGLYVLNKAIQKLEGSIDFDSQINKYTEFKIVLPDQNPA